MTRKKALDVAKTLYDSDGYRHTLVRATPLQIITLVEGFYWLWDRRTGRCLIEGMAGATLCNSRPDGDDLRGVRDPVAETRAFFIAQKAVRTAAVTSALALAEAAPAGAAAPSCDPRHAVAVRQVPRACVQRLSPSERRGATASSFLGAVFVMGLVTMALLLPDGLDGAPAA